MEQETPKKIDGNVSSTPTSDLSAQVNERRQNYGRRASDIPVPNVQASTATEWASYLEKRLQTLADQLLAQIKANDESSQERHNVLVHQLTILNGRTEHIESAFLKGSEGHPDFEGHRLDHAARKHFSEWLKSVKEKTLQKIIEYIALAIMIWIAHSLWSSVIMGVK